jgi:hypothetical protein
MIYRQFVSNQSGRERERIGWGNLEHFVTQNAKAIINCDEMIEILPTGDSQKDDVR